MSPAMTRRRSLGGALPAAGLAGKPVVLDSVQEEPAGAGAERGLRRLWSWWTHARQQPQARWTRGQALLTFLVQAVLVLSMLCGPIGLWLVTGADNGGAPAATAASGYDERAESRRSQAEWVAQEWVVAWLSTARGQEEKLSAYLPSAQIELPERAAVVHRAQVISALPADVGVWAVTVAVDLEPVPAAPAARRYYRVPVQVQGEGESATAGVMALPAQVPAPKNISAGTQMYGARVEPSSPLGASVDAFVQAAISGRADEVARYSSPQADLRAALDPAQSTYAAVQVTSISATANPEERGAGAGSVPADGATARVKAEVLLHEKGAEEGRASTWFLTLTTRAGRWEVSAVDLSPVIPQEDTTIEGEQP